MLTFRDLFKFLWQLWLYWSWGDIWLRPCLNFKYKRAYLFVPSVLWGTVNLPLYLLKNMNWGIARSEKRNYVQMKYWAVPSAMGGKPLPGRDGPQSCAWACRVSPRYAVLCGQLAEHEGIQRRIQRVALASRWERLLFLPWCWSSAGDLAPA